MPAPPALGPTPDDPDTPRFLPKLLGVELGRGEEKYGLDAEDIALIERCAPLGKISVSTLTTYPGVGSHRHPSALATILL